MSPVRSFSVLPPSHRATFHSADPPAGHAAANSILLSGDIMALVTKEMDMTTAMKARAVCKSWRRFVKEADLEPLETGASEQEKALGREGQQHLEEALALENQVWTPQHTAKIAQHLTHQQEVLASPFSPLTAPFSPFVRVSEVARTNDMDAWRQITAEMRRTLVNWLIEVHFKFRFREPCLHLTIQLVCLPRTPYRRQQTFAHTLAKYAHARARTPRSDFWRGKGWRLAEQSKAHESPQASLQQGCASQSLRERYGAMMVLKDASGVCVCVCVCVCCNSWTASWPTTW